MSTTHAVEVVQLAEYGSSEHLTPAYSQVGQLWVYYVHICTCITAIHNHTCTDKSFNT